MFVLVFAPPSFILIRQVSTLGMALSWDFFHFRMSRQSFELQHDNMIL
jgi:hypothetical protein